MSVDKERRRAMERHGYVIMDNNQMNNYDNNSGRNPNGQGNGNGNGNGGNNNGNGQNPKKQNLLILKLNMRLKRHRASKVVLERIIRTSNFY